MEFTYETQGANSFLVYAVNEKEEIDTLTLGMITNNKISGFLPAIFTQVDDIRYVKYNISSKISAFRYFFRNIRSNACSRRLYDSFK